MKKTNKFIMLIIFAFILFAGIRLSINAFDETNKVEESTVKVEEKVDTNDEINNSTKDDSINVPKQRSITKAATIADLVGQVKISNTNPYSDTDFNMEILINSISNGAETTDGIAGYTISFKIPETVDLVAYENLGAYTVSPSNPKSGDIVTLTFKDELMMAKLQKIKMTFRFKVGVSVHTDTFAPDVTLSADNADGVVITTPLTTAKNIAIPEIMKVVPDKANPTFVHGASIELQPERNTVSGESEYKGAVNHYDSDVRITFPIEADVFSIMYNGTKYDVVDNGTNKVAIIPLADLKVTEGIKTVDILYSYPSLTAPGSVNYEITVEYIAKRIKTDAPIHESYVIKEEVVYNESAGPSTTYFSKVATDSILRKSNKAVNYTLTFHPIGDTKNVSIIDDPQRGVEADFFKALEYQTIKWNADAGKSPLFNKGIKTELLYELNSNPGTWISAGQAALTGSFDASSKKTSTDFVTKLKFAFTYDGSIEVPAAAGRVIISAFAITNDKVNDVGTLDDGITNSAYIIGEKKGVQASNYETIVDDGVSNLNTSLTTWKQGGALIGFAGWENPFTPSMNNINEEFKFKINVANLGDTMYDAVAYLTVPSTIEITDISFPYGSFENVEYKVLDNGSRKTVVITFNEDMPNLGFWNGSKFQVEFTAKGKVGVNTSETFSLVYATKNPDQQFQWGSAGWINIPNVGGVNAGAMSNRDVQFNISLSNVSSTLASTDDVDYAQTANRVVTSPTGDPGYYLINVKNEISSENNLNEVHIIDMLPSKNDTMTISGNKKNSSFNPIVNGITLLDGSAIPSNYEIYYSMDATSQSNKTELTNLTNISATWLVWDGISDLPANAKAVKLIKKDGLVKGESVSFKLKVNLPSGLNGFQTAWNSVSVGGSYTGFNSEESFIVPGEPNKSGIYVSDVDSDKKLAGTIWEDLNGNDLRDASEPTMSNMNVRLYDWNDDLVASTTTDTNGYYEFNGLYPTKYRVEFDNKLTYNFSNYKVGSDASIDSNFTDYNSDEKIGTANVNLANETKPLNIDAGLYRYTSIGDFVWDDYNQDGKQTSFEPGVKNAKVNLYRMDNGVETLVKTTNTDSNGIYHFTSLKPGTYLVKLTQIANYVPTVVLSSDNTINSKLESTWQTKAIDLISNVPNSNIDLGIVSILPVGSISLLKVNEADVALPGAVFGLWHSSDDPSVDAPITSQTSQANGTISFVGVEQGNYKLKEISSPSGFTLNNTIHNITIDGSNLNISLGSITNVLTKGKISFNKLNENSEALAGAVFGIWNAADDTTGTALKLSTSNAQGLVEFTNMNLGSYKIKEVFAPSGYIVSGTIYTTNISDSNLNVTISDITNAKTTGSITFKKLNEASLPLANAVFGIWNSTDDLSISPIKTSTSDNNGKVQFMGMAHGSYKIKEITAPTGYVLSTTVYNASVSASDLTITLADVSNAKATGSVTFNKLDENSTGLAGAVFGIWNASDDTTGTPLKTATSLANGKVEFTNMDQGSYKIKEITAPSGYVLSNTIYNASVTATNLIIVLADVSNVKATGSITFSKVDDNDTALAGAVFGIWNASDDTTGAPLKSATSDVNGKVEFTNMAQASYKIKEISAPTGYTTSGTIYNASISATNLIITLSKVTNAKALGSVKFNKVDEESTPLSGAVFGIWNASDDTTGAPLKSATSDINGKVEFTNMAQGSYKVKETTAPTGYNTSTTIYNITISASDLNATLANVVNIKTLGSVTLNKVNDNSQALAGAVFGIWNASDDTSGAALKTVTSDATGKVEFTNMPLGNYKVKEVSAPSGYVVSTTIHTVSLTSTDVNVSLGSIANVKTVGSITLTKIDENNQVLAGATFGIWNNADDTSGAPIKSSISNASGVVIFTGMSIGDYKIKEISAPSGYVLSTSIHTATISSVNTSIDLGQIANVKATGSISFVKIGENSTNLAGAIFGIWNASDYTTGPSIKTATSNASGVVLFSGMPQGNYKIKEVTPPSGYALAGTIYTVTINATNLSVTLANIVNVKTTGSVTFNKVDENDSPLQNATFGIWNASDDTTGAPLKTATSNATGQVIFTGMAHGDYKIKETSAPSGYALSTTIYTASISVTDLNITLSKVINAKTTGSISFTKKDDNNTALAGAIFGIWDASSDTTGVPIKTSTSDVMGKVEFTGMAHGDYKIKETTAPTGYALSNTIYTATINAANLVISLPVVTNVKAQGSISFYKVDDNDAPLAGAIFGVWNASDDMSGVPIKSSTSDVNGKVEFTDLAQGDYKIKETSAPTGYTLKTNVYTASITSTNLIVTLTKVTNAKALGSVSFIKEDAESNVLAGATFGIWNASDDTTGPSLKSATSNALGQVSFTDLAQGNYKIKEISAPIGYVTSNVIYTTSITGTTLSATLTNIINTKATGSISFIKKDDNNAVLAGAIFGIWNAADDTTGPALKNATSQIDGKVEFTGMSQGSYKIKETSAPSGYVTSNTIYNASITGSNLTVNIADIVNTKATGSISFTKNNESSTPLEDAVFGIWDSASDTSGAPIKSATSNTLGKVEFTNMSQGSYKIKEISSPSGYSVSNTIYNATISASNLIVSLSNVSNAKAVGDVSFVKIDENSNALAGATFGIWHDIDDTSGLPIKTSTSNSLGKVEFTGMAQGSYKVKELTSPAGYKLSPTIYSTTISATDLVKVLANVTNTKALGKISFTKKDDNNTVLSGATFGIWNATDDTTGPSLKNVTSNVSGLVEFTDMAQGNYKIKEVSAPVGYTLSNAIYTATITSTDLSISLSDVTNTKTLGKISFTKKDNNNTALAGAIFGIWNGTDDTTGPALKNTTSDVNGLIEFSDMAQGNYKIKEVSAPSGYVLSTSIINATITSTNLNISLADFINTTKKGSVQILKTDDKNTVLSGAQFTLYDKNNIKVSEKTSDLQGKIVFSNLSIGEYTLIESKQPKGYKENKKVYNVKITDSNLLVDLGKIINYKENSTTDKPVIKPKPPVVKKPTNKLPKSGAINISVTLVTFVSLLSSLVIIQKMNYRKF